jgi:hypothetical protein
MRTVTPSLKPRFRRSARVTNESGALDSDIYFHAGIWICVARLLWYFHITDQSRLAMSLGPAEIWR